MDERIYEIFVKGALSIVRVLIVFPIIIFWESRVSHTLLVICGGILFAWAFMPIEYKLLKMIFCRNCETKQRKPPLNIKW